MSLPDNYFTNKSKPYIVTDEDLDEIVNDVNDALFIDGSRKMTGDLDLDDNQLLNSGNITMSGTSTVDGVDVSEVLILYKDVTDVDYNDSFPLTLFSLPAEYRIQSMIIYVGTAFNGSEVFSIGITTDNDAFIQSFAPSSTGFISTTKGDELDVNKGMISSSSATDVNVYEVSGSGSTTGQFTVYITYEKIQS